MKSNEFINKLIKENKHFVFVSPHFDDAALSCGSLISELTKKDSKVTVINIFTTAHKGPYTFSAKKFLKTCGHDNNATLLYKKREEEDKKALKSINVAKIINLDLQDALFRKKKVNSFLEKIIPELSHFYPIFRFHILKSPSKNDQSIKLIGRKLKTIIPKNAVVFAPLAIGNHVDHQITRLACEEKYGNVIYYSDFPYNTVNNSYKQLRGKYQKINLEVNISKKTKLIQYYQTQFLGLFPNGKLPKHKEVFFTK